LRRLGLGSATPLLSVDTDDPDIAVVPSSRPRPPATSRWRGRPAAVVRL
jgi:hypothetical protein